MRELLSKNQNRQIDIVDYLVQANGWIHIDELAKVFKVSTRAIKIDLAFLRDNIKGLDILFSTNGVRIELPQNLSTEVIYPYYYSHSVCYEILEYLFLCEKTNVSDITQQLFITTSTLNRYIQKINTNLKKKFDFQISKKTLQFVGNEQDIRFFFVQYFTEKTAFFDWPFDFIDESSLEKILVNIFKSSNFPQSFESYRVFKMIFTVNFFRTYQGHFVENIKEQDKFYDYYNQLEGLGEIVQQFTKETGLIVTPEILEQSFSIFLQPHFFLTLEEFSAARKENERARLSFESLVTKIQTLEKRYNIKCENYDLLLWHLHNTSQLERIEIHSDFILFDKKIPLLNFFRSLCPNFYKDVTELLENYQHEVKNVNRQRNISHLIYTFYTHWEGLVSQLQAKQEKIKVLILNDFDEYYPKFLASYLEQNAANRFEYHTYDDLEISLDLLEKTEYKVILSNFALPEIKGKTIICSQDLSMIDLINELNKL